MRTSLAWTALFILASSPESSSRIHAQCSTWNAAFDLPGPSNTVRALTTFDDGTGPVLYAGGEFTMVEGTPASRIAKWDGSSWSPLGNGVAGAGIPAVKALAVFDDGTGPKVYAGGYFSTAGGIPASNIAEWDGSAWSALGNGVNGDVLALRVFDDGSGPALYVGGTFTAAGGATAAHLAKWDGSNWSGVGHGVNGEVRALDVFDAGAGTALYVGGTFTSAAGKSAKNIARWSGSVWSALGMGLQGEFSGVSALAVFDDGSGAALYAGGYFSAAGSASASNVAKWNGATWSALGTGVSDEVLALCALDDGSGPALHAGGWFKMAGTVPADRVAKWDGSSWSMPGKWPAASIAWSPYSLNALATFGSGPGQTLCAGFSVVLTYGETLRLYLASWDGSAWTPVGNAGGTTNDVSALAVYGDASSQALYAGGSFVTAGSTSAKRIAKWNGSKWSALGSGMNGGVSALTAFDDGSGPALYAGGSFTAAGSARARHVARWNGSSWSALGGGMNGDVTALTAFDDGSGPALYAGGSFTTAGSVRANRVARWDGSAWSRLGSGVDGAVYALAVFDDGSGPALYAGGSFAFAGGASVNQVARWNGSTWSALGSGVVGGHVRALAVYTDGSGPALYAGGYFSSVGGVSAKKIARWNGSSWSAVGIGSGPWSSPSGNTISAMTVFDDGSSPALYVGDSSFSDLESAKLHKWNGSTWSLVDHMSEGMVNALAVFDGAGPGGPDLFVGGRFHHSVAVGSYSWDIAQWLGCGPSGP